jgi:hypothetical protein
MLILISLNSPGRMSCSAIARDLGILGIRCWDLGLRAWGLGLGLRLL